MLSTVLPSCCTGPSGKNKDALVKTGIVSPAITGLEALQEISKFKASNGTPPSVRKSPGMRFVRAVLMLTSVAFKFAISVTPKDSSRLAVPDVIAVASELPHVPTL
jgi:hypothetical protein